MVFHLEWWRWWDSVSRELRARSSAGRKRPPEVCSVPLPFESLFCSVMNSFPHSLLWWRWWDSNPWPPACRAGALPAELHPHFFTPRVCTVPSFGFCFSLPFSNPRSGFYSTPQVSVSIELSSRTVARKVLSPLQSLTSVFGMGTGGPSAFVTLTILQFSKALTLDPWKLNNILSKSPSRSSSNR